MNKIPLLLLLLLGLIAVAPARAQDRPNVLLLMVDDLRPEVGFQARPYMHTPNMDRLARSGTIFDKAYCQVPVCGASRASMLTGILPTRDRFLGAAARADQDFPDAVTLPQAFKEAGYTSISLGKIFNSGDDSEEESWSEPAWRPEGNRNNPLDPASAKFVNPENGRGPFFEKPDVPDDAYFDGKVAVRAMETLDRLKDDESPFFLAVGFVKPHLPFYAPKKYWDLYDHEQIELAGNRYLPHNLPEIFRGSPEILSYHRADIEYNSDEWHRTAIHGYRACVSYVDAQIGKILDKLEALGLADNTIIVLVGDHGWHLGEHNIWGKHNNLQHAIRVPLVVADPRIPAPVSRNDALVGMIDIFPTLCDLAGIPAPGNQLQGHNMQPLLEGPTPATWREAIYTRFLSGDNIVTDAFSLTRFIKDGTPRGKMLFDLHNDPAENWNVVDDPNYADVARQLEEELDRFIEKAESKKPAK